MARKSKGLGSIRKEQRKNGTYYIGTVSLGYNEDGTQNRMRKGSYNPQEVKDWIKSVNNKVFTPMNEKTLIDYTIQYLEENKKNKVKASTYELYETRIERYLKPYAISDMKIGDINPQIAKNYTEKLSKNASIPNHNFMLAFMKAQFKELHDNGDIPINPFAKIDNIKYKKQVREALTKTEQALIMQELNLEDKRDLAIYIAFCTGCRLGEIMGLSWESIKDGKITIDTQYAITTKSKFEMTNLKTINSVRENPIPSKALEEIEKHRETGLIFSDDGEKPFDRKRVQRRYKQICELYGIDSTFHSIRHTYITRLYEAGVSPKTAQALAGHSSLETTLGIYTHVSSEIKKSSVETLNLDL